MQRVSSFLPSWEKRNSNSAAISEASANSVTSVTSVNSAAPTSKPSGRPSGLFGWTGRNSNNTTNNDNTATSTGKQLARINIAAANANGGRVQREAFWPSTLDMECAKAARILKSFCADGYLAPVDVGTSTPSPNPTSEPQSPASITKKIPKRIIQNAAGIAVFTCMRSGLWMTGSGGSGILIARKSDGTWSPPSGIMLHTPTLSFIIGVDVYDCVLVVTNLAALEAISRPRVTLGEDVTLNNGPSVSIDSDDVASFNWKDLDNTVLAYMKARGQHQAVNLQGCILTERGNENERFYGVDITHMDILAGNVGRHVDETRPLFEVIKMAEGRTDYDKAVIEHLAVDPAPGDAVIASPKSIPASRHSFGIPKPDDPDPFGVLALEMAGLEIREAGTRLRPASSQFEINSNPRSPTLSKFGRQSVDTFVSKSNRASVMSSRTVKSQMTDAGTQTGGTAETTPSPGQSEDGHETVYIDRIPEDKEIDEVDYTAVDFTPLRHLSQQHSMDLVLPAEEPVVPPRNKLRASASSRSSKEVEQPSSSEGTVEEEEEPEYDTNDADDEDDLDEEPVVFEVAQVQPTRTRAVASRMIQAKGSVVTIAKRIPPPLPTRSPARNSRSMRSDIGSENAPVSSPLRQAFSEADLRADEAKNRDQSQDKTANAGTRKSADHDQLHSKKFTETELRMGEDEASGDAPQVDENKDAQTTPSINQLVIPGDFPADDSTEGDKNSSVVELAEEAPLKNPEVSKAIAPEDIPLPDDTDAMTVASKPDEPESDSASVDASGTEDYESIKVPVDISDSTASKKHTSSIYTGMTEDRWSIDRSSLTTPTSERPLSVAEYSTEEDTPRKTVRDAELETKKHEQKQAANKPLEALSESTTVSA